MKKYFYLLGILSLTASCGTATYMYDDVYDVAEGKSLTEEGYTDLIKDNEKDHKVVVDKNDGVTFGGYYPSNNQSSGGTSFSDNNNCSCACGQFGNSNQWRYHQPGWTYNNMNSLWFNDCSCNHWNNNLAYHYSSFGNVYNLYGYYDYWGGWHPYYSWGMDPYGYYSYQYGWYPYQWYNNNNGIFNGNNIVIGNPSGGSNTNDGGNHFYGHRNPSSTGSSNTTVYAHTVKEDYFKPTSTATNQTAVKPDHAIVLTDGSNGIINKPAGTNEEANVVAQPFGTGFISDPTTDYQSPKPVSTNGGVTSGNSLPVTTTSDYAGGTTSTTVTNGTTNHVAASNQFEVKYPSTATGGTGSGQTNGTQHVNPVNQNSGTTTYYPAPVVTNTSGSYTTNSTSRSTSSSYNSGSTNTNSNSSGTYSGSNSSTGHRTTTTSTNSGSGSSTTSGGTRTTSTSRR